ncbi:MAG: GFA family protein [Proteobacteria bacterium]|nr:GFA family protein [Pseudomonadota bacterium]
MQKISVPGRCRCGRVRFVLGEEPIAFYLCHCTDCQAESGSAFGQSMAVRAEAIQSVEGPTREHTIEHEGERRSFVTHCTNCLTMLWGYGPELPQIRGLNAGGLDASLGLAPYGNMWTRSAQPWVRFAPGPCFEQQPDDRLAMVKAWAERPNDD